MSTSRGKTKRRIIALFGLLLLLPVLNLGPLEANASAQGALTVELYENPFVCNGHLRTIGAVVGLQPNETIQFSSPQMGGMFSQRVSDSDGRVSIRWRCNWPTQWSVSVRSLATGANTNFSIAGVTSLPETPPVAAPEPTATPEPTPEPTATPEPAPEPTATPEPAPEPTATPEPTPEPTATPEPTPEPTATPEPTPEPTATPEPTPEPTATPEPTPEPTATPEPTPEPTATPEPTPEPTATAEAPIAPERHVTAADAAMEPEPARRLAEEAREDVEQMKKSATLAAKPNDEQKPPTQLAFVQPETSSPVVPWILLVSGGLGVLPAVIVLALYTQHRRGGVVVYRNPADAWTMS